MITEVTKHAINRYRERLFDYSSSEEKIRRILLKIARQGKQVNWRPSSSGNCFEVTFRGVSIVLVQDEDKNTIITCLGRSNYRRWVKHQDKIRIKGRVLYPEKAI